ncbi:MAG: endonuclease [Saprospiraceae bacterium]|nr:MAG: endonuclease [Saprospiraceae bacterium]
MKIVIIVIGLLGVIGTVIPLSKSDHWSVRMFDFPCAQIAILLIISLAGGVYFKQYQSIYTKLFTLAVLAALIYQGFIIYPYTFLAKPQVLDSTSQDDANTISLLTTNVLISNRDYTRLLKIIRQSDPDIVLLLEPDQWWQKKMEGLKTDYPFFVEQPQDNAYGMLLYSKKNLKNPTINFLVADDIPSIHTYVKLASGQSVQLYCIHPTPPSPTENDESTERDAELMIVGKKVAHDNLPTIVAGDLNDVAWSSSTRLFLKTSKLLDPRIGRGFYNTFHAKIFILRWPLDHFFHSNHFKLVDLKRLPKIGSDHFPIYTKLTFEPSATLQQKEPQATFEEKVEAQKQIEKVQKAQD